MKFSDLLIASTSGAHEEICFWEPKTLAPYEPMVDRQGKFVASPNTLAINAGGHILAAHGQKTTANIWRWDKKDPVLKFPLKELQSVLRFSHNAAAFCVGGSKTGRLSVWEVATGTLLGEVESAHYMEVTDLDIAILNDLVITGGKDFKVKVWIVAE